MSITTNFFDRELVAHLYERYHALVEAYPPKNRILGVTRARFEEASRAAFEKGKLADIVCATPDPLPRTDTCEAQSPHTFEANFQHTPRERVRGD